MANLQERLIESMLKDLENIQDFDHGKILRKECSLLQKRIDSARKLFSGDETILKKLQDIELKVRELKNT